MTLRNPFDDDPTPDVVTLARLRAASRLPTPRTPGPGTGTRLPLTWWERFCERRDARRARKSK